VPEGTSTATTVYTAAANDVQGGAVTFSLGGADAAAFTINASTGAVTFNASPNYEAQSSYSFNVIASDGTLTSSQAVTVAVTDIAPAITSGTSVSVPEGIATSTVVYTAAATDVQGGTVTFSLGGADAAAFTINGATGAVTFNASPDFETKSAYSFNVVASDGTLTSNQAVTVTVTDVNDAPSGANTTVGTLQNTTYTFGAGDFGFSDPDAGATMAAVRIDTLPAAGSLTLAGFGPVTAGQLISRADIDAGNLQFTPATNASGAAYASLSFSVSDGSLLDIAPNTITIDVGWVNQAPTITSSTSATVAEGISTSTVVYAASATDPDPDTITFSLAGADAAAFTINASTGAVTFNASPDFETKSSYTFNVVASDGTTTTGQAVTLTVTDVAPSITSATSVSVPEGSATSTVVYTAAATDVQGGAVSFSLTGADAAAFTINGATGAVTFNASPDFETKSSYSINVRASDPSGAFNTQAVTISVTDVAPTITSATSVTVPEGVSTATVVYTAAATDVQGGTVSFSLSGADAAAFTINPATGAVTFNASPDFETKSSYTFNVVASDGTQTSVQAVTVGVTNLNDAPVLAISIPDQSIAAGAAFSYSVPASTFADPDGDPLTYSATLANGSPLPAWLTFNPATRAFTGTSPMGFTGIDIRVVASDGTFSVSDDFTLSLPSTLPSTTTSASSQPADASVILTDGTQGSGGAISTQPAGAGATAVPAGGSTPATELFGTLPLGQPVDSTVGVSRLNPNAPIPGSNVPTALDLNALPAPGADRSDLFGFPVSRVSQEEALRMGGADAPALGGHWLFVYHGIPNMQINGDGIGSVRIPEDAFAHTDPSAIVQLDARLIDGSPLPSWLKFEGLRGQFTGVPPEGFTGSLEIEVVARDSNGREARALFVLLMEDLRNQDGLRAHDVPDLMLGLDVDAKEREKARLEAARQAAEGRPGDKTKAKVDGKPQKEPAAASFTDQVRAAKGSRDPLLDRIAKTGPGTPGPRR